MTKLCVFCMWDYLRIEGSLQKLEAAIIRKRVTFIMDAAVAAAA